MAKAKLQKGITRMGWTPYWLVDEHGCLLNTEPVCSVPDEKWHPWFIRMLEDFSLDYPFELEHHTHAPEVQPSGAGRGDSSAA